MSKFVKKHGDLSLALALLFSIGLFTSAFIISSCAVESTATNTVDTGGTSGNTTGAAGNTIDTGAKGQDVAVTDFKVSFDTNSEYTMKWSKDANNDFAVSSAEYGTECTATSGRVQCILDMNELDIWPHGYTINVELPGDMCAYLGQEHYYYATANIGEMPNKVMYKLDSEANISDLRYCFPSGSCTNAAYVTNWADESVLGYSGGNSPTLTRTVGRWKAEKTASDIKCPYDYTKFSTDGKSCCKGDYTTVAFNALDLADEPTETETSWGGSPLNCFSGPAIDDDLAKVSTTEGGIFAGFPEYHITEVIGEGYGTEYKLPALKTFSPRINLYFANYFNPADHAHSLDNCDALDRIDDPPANCPMASGGLTVSANSAGGTVGYPFFTFECLDHNFEVVARIDVLTREWNTKGELDKGASGDPDVEGSESSPFSPQDKNDYCDWKDWSDNTCGGFNYGILAAGYPYYHLTVDKK